MQLNETLDWSQSPSVWPHFGPRTDSLTMNGTTGVLLYPSRPPSRKRSNSDLEDTFYRDIITIACYSLIIFVSLCGNSLVLRVIASRKKLQTTTNLLIASLALADILTTTLNIPFNVTRFLSMNYPFGALFCKLVPFIQVCCVYVSTLTMGVIAIHRYVTITCPHRSAGPTGASQWFHRTLCRLGLIIAIIWLVAAALALPHSMFNQIVPVTYRNVTYIRCRAEHPKIKFNFPFWLSVEAFLTQYLIPLSITCTLYIKIGFVVSKQGRLASKSNNKRKKEQDDARRRRIIMLALVVLVFALCWLPLNVYHLLVDFHFTKPNFSIFLVCHWIAMSSVCYNPFIYCWLNESFRKGAFKLLSWACICCPQLKLHLLSQKETRSSKRDSLNNEQTVMERITLNHTTVAPASSLITSNVGPEDISSKIRPCKKSPNQTASTTPKERRKFKKLRLNSFRKHGHSREAANNNNNENNPVATTTTSSCESSSGSASGSVGSHSVTDDTKCATHSNHSPAANQGDSECRQTATTFV